MNTFKIQLHPFYYVMALICVLTGHFRDFFLFSFLIFIHECGHALGGIFFHWKIEKIILYPFGGLTKFDGVINRPLKEEWVVLILGPLFQCLFYFLYTLYRPDFHLFLFHKTLFLFNLLPIMPLDGSKGLNLIFNHFFSFQKSYKITLLFSFFLLPFLFFYDLSFLFLCIFFLLLKKNIEEFSKRELLFHKFLLERYLYVFSFRKTKIIKGECLNQMKRDYKHLFYIENCYHTEKEILKKKFDFLR